MVDTMVEPSIDLIRHGPRLDVVLNNPERRNALTLSMLDALEAAFTDAARDSDVRVVVLRGAGSKAFSAGYDLTALPTSSDQADRFDAAERLARTAAAIAACPKPVVAAIAGACMGAGGELAVTCDMRIAADTLAFAMPPAKIGLVYDEIGLQRFVALIGPAATKDLFFSGRRITAAEAKAMGLVNWVVPAAELDAAVTEVTTTLAANAPLAIRGIKAIVDAAVAAPFSQAQRAEFARLRLQAFASNDYREGLAAILGKREPTFTGS